MRFKIHFFSIAAFLAVIALIAAVTAIPVAADEWYQNINLAGPTSGSAGDTLTYTYTAQHCSGDNPANPPPPAPNGLPPSSSMACGPITGTVHFDVSGPSSRSGDLAVFSGTAGIQYQFTEAGQYSVQAEIPGHPETFQSISVNIQSKVSPPSVGTTSSGASSVSPSGGGLALPALPALSDLLGQGSSQNTTAGAAAESAGAAGAASSAWTWLLAIAIIILLAIIVVVLLLRRGGRDYEPYDERDYERRRRRR